MARRELELWAVSDIARSLRVDVSTARRWTGAENFPTPAGYPGGRPCWHAGDVRSWRKALIADRLSRRAF